MTIRVFSMLKTSTLAGTLVDFIIFDLTNIFYNGTLLKTVYVSIFISNNDIQQNQIQNDQEQQQDKQDESHHQQQRKRIVSHKIRKNISLSN